MASEPVLSVCPTTRTVVAGLAFSVSLSEAILAWAPRTPDVSASDVRNEADPVGHLRVAVEEVHGQCGARAQRDDASTKRADARAQRDDAWAEIADAWASSWACASNGSA